MSLHPMISTLRRHKAGVVLIVLQIALTLAVVSNAIFLIHQRMERASRPTGTIEDGLIRVSQSWFGAPKGNDAASIEKLDAMQRADLAALRVLPDVMDAAASTSMPLQGMIYSGNLSLNPQQTGLSVTAAYYYGDERLRPTLDVRLVAGRDFRVDEILHHGIGSNVASPVVIVSEPVANKLFPQGDALGKTIYQDGKPATIVGVVERLQTPTTQAWGSTWGYNSVLEPVRLDGASASYAVRARPGREQAVMREVRKALLAVDPLRVMPESWGIQSLSQIRAKVYRADHAVALLLGVICAILLGVTAAGIVGLTSFWVGQRRKQIGVRRALGARKADIVHYFRAENLLIAGVGVTLGALLAALLNLWLMTRYAMPRLPLGYLLGGVLGVLVLGQFAVWAPARRASSVPPVVATRSA